ncbi:MAG: DUF2779 domain-containing protein [Planctomycetes bacterium]|nr:DUF2779 domain-containing protein [Planctomycetota bacterium]
MSKKKAASTAESRASITKPLFEAGMQCAKRLYLEQNEARSKPEPSEYQQELQELGQRLVELASQPFPKGIDLGKDEIEDALKKTHAFLTMGKPGVLFHAAFRGGGVEVRVDVVLVSAKAELDLFEVKAGTTVKPRHLQDIALQIRAIEASGFQVKSASILHLDPRYVHDGSANYPVHKLFRSVDVTRRARRQIGRVEEQVENFTSILEDEGTLDLPTGTWCKNPLPCPFLERCVKQGPDHPLVELPQLTVVQERRLHEEAVESVTQLDPEHPGLNPQQRRVVRGVVENRLVVEPFVPEELKDVDWPLSFVHIGWHLEPLPRLPKTKPWLKLPFAWSVHRIGQTGYVACNSFVSSTADDPRRPVLESLVKELSDAGTVVVYGNGHDERLRALLDLDPELKPKLRNLLQAPLLEIGSLIYHGVYHPGFGGHYELETVYRTLAAVLAEPTRPPIPELIDESDLEITDDEAASRAYAKIIAKRTRSTTRDKLGAELDRWAKRSSAMLYDLWRMLK